MTANIPYPHHLLPRDSRITIGERTFRVDEPLGRKHILRPIIGDDLRQYTSYELARLAQTGELKIPEVSAGKTGGADAAYSTTDPSVVDPVYQAEAARRLYYVQVYRNIPRGCRTGEKAQRVLDAAALRRNDSKPHGVRAVQKWWWLYTRGKNKLRALLPRHAFELKRQRRLHQTVFQLLVDAIEECWLTPDQLSLAEVHGILNDELEELRQRNPADAAALATPHISTLQRYIKTLDEYHVMACRMGEKAAFMWMEQKQRGPRYKRPLEAVFIDTARLDVFIRDEKGRKTERPYLTAVVDAATRMILGICVSREPPSWNTVMQALRNAFMTKDYVKILYGDFIKLEWPCYGLPKRVISDMGAEHFNMQMPTALASLGVDVRYTPAGKPWYRGIIERIFRTFNQGLIHSLPGTTRSNPTERGERDAAAEAQLTLDELRREIHKFIIDVYHPRRHRILKMSPLQRWGELCEDYEVDLPPSEQELVILLAAETTGKVTHEGISLFGLQYRSSALSVFLTGRRRSAEVVIKYDPTDISKIWVLHEGDQWIAAIPEGEEEYTRFLSKQEHDRIQAEIRIRYDKDPSPKTRLAMRAELTREYFIERPRRGRLFRRRAGRPQQNQPYGTNVSGRAGQARVAAARDPYATDVTMIGPDGSVCDGVDRSRAAPPISLPVRLAETRPISVRDRDGEQPFPSIVPPPAPPRPPARSAPADPDATNASQTSAGRRAQSRGSDASAGRSAEQRMAAIRRHAAAMKVTRRS